jgi:putative transposase
VQKIIKTRAVSNRESTTAVPALGGATDALHEHLRPLIRELVEQLVRAELEAVLQAGPSVRCPDGTRRGYRHAARDRTLTTSCGASVITVPRARLFDAQGAASQEWQSQLLPRYHRRSRAVDETVLGAYLAGTNTRRMQRALQPLLKGAPLSKSAVSRVMRTLRESFEAWRTRPLEDEPIAYLFLDGIAVKVRVDRRVQSVPVLVALGVTRTGEKRLLALRLMGNESKAAWGTVVEDLASRGLPAPVLVVMDGNAGLRHAVGQAWPQAAVQRCVVHKLRNLEAHAPKRVVDEIRATFHAITEADSERAARAAYARFLRTWRTRAESVARSLEEGGNELLTFFRFPRSQWKCIRTTNMIERLNEEFRRRLKTQGSHPLEASVLRLLFALYQSGQITLRRLDGWYDIPRVMKQQRQVAA